MGGQGSTRWGGHRAARTVETCAALPIGAVVPALRGAGPPVGTIVRSLTSASGGVLRAAWDVAWALERGDDGAATILLSVEAAYQGRGSQARGQIVHVVTTAPQYGGVRYWWSCPRCAGRCATLYLPPGATRPACRACYGLTYRVCQAHDKKMDRYRRMPPWERVALLDRMAGDGLSGPGGDSGHAAGTPEEALAALTRARAGLDELLRVIESVRAPAHRMDYYRRRVGR
jgi:hypothetical protein